MSIFQNDKDRLTRKYRNIPDLALVAIITTPPYDSEAAAYLIYVRYYECLKQIYFCLFNGDKGNDKEEEFKDALSNLYEKLYGENYDWANLRSYNSSKAKFSTWFIIVARHNFFDFIVNFRELKKDKTTKEYIPRKYSLDDDTSEYHIEKIDMASPDEEDIEWEEWKKAKFLACIAKLDEDKKFAILKRLEKGYTDDQIADLLKQKWQKEGKCKYKNGAKVIPNKGYVSVLLSRAMDDLREMLNNQINK